MKNKIKFYLVFIFIFSGCQKESDPIDLSETQKIQLRSNQEIEQVDIQINTFLDQLDNPKTPLGVKKQILCIDYPNFYILKYIPTLVEVDPNVYSSEKLLRDLNLALDYYKDKLKIQCELD